MILLSIAGELVKPTKEITINTLELKLTTAKLVSQSGKGHGEWESSTFSDDTQKQRSTITFPEEIQSSAKATLTIGFTGIINHDMAGFYRAQYGLPKKEIRQLKQTNRSTDTSLSCRQQRVCRMMMSSTT